MQSILTKNHFELFNLPVSFEIDMTTLTEHYREMQRAMHPDKFANSTERERRIAMQHAAQINEAFQTLKDPLERAHYLLDLNNIKADDNDTSMDPAFLMEQIELRESLDNIRESKDQEALASLSENIEAYKGTAEKQLTDCFTDGSREALIKALSTVRELQFLTRLKEEVGNLEDELEFST